MTADKYAEFRRILRKAEVQKLTGLSYTSIWRKEKAGEFPSRVRLGKNSIGWRESSVMRWVDEREAVK